MSDQVQVLTGASSGIGAALAPLLAEDGPVALLARRQKFLEEVAKRIEDKDKAALVIPCDVSNRAAVAEAFARIRSDLGPVSRLVMNAGLGLPTRADAFQAEAVEEQMRVNYFGPAYCIEEALPSMLEQGRGHLIGISSLAALRGVPQAGGYAASKAALTTLMESLRLELRKKGVDVTVIQPGFVETAMTAQNGKMPFLMKADDAAERIYDAILAKKRMVDFPLPTSLMMRTMRMLPTPLYDALMGKG